MDGKKKVLEFLNLKSIGKKELKLSENVGEFAPLYVERLNGDKGFVVGKYNEASLSYYVHYDPRCSDGIISNILCSFKQKEEKPKKSKKEDKSPTDGEDPTDTNNTTDGEDAGQTE